MAFQSRIKVLIISATKTYYDGEAFAISSKNEVGPFDVLEGHRDFISLISDAIIIRQTARKELEIPLSHGVLTVKNNVVTIYLGI